MQAPNPFQGKSFSLPTWSNTAVFSGRDDPAILQIEAGLTPEMFRERFGGEPVAHEDQVFRGESIDKAIGPLGHPDGWVVIGWDVARIRDYSVAIALNSLRQVVEIQRWRGVSWVQQVGRIEEMYKRLRAQRIAIDSTGLGDPITELIWRKGLAVSAVTITQQVKAEMIDRLAIALDRGELTIPRDAALIGELWDFQATERASGKDKLEASPGHHDDTVISLALALTAMGNHTAEAPELPPEEEDVFHKSLREEFERAEGTGDSDWWAREEQRNPQW
jgi:hypothetical protein